MYSFLVRVVLKNKRLRTKLEIKGLRIKLEIRDWEQNQKAIVNKKILGKSKFPMLLIIQT